MQDSFLPNSPKVEAARLRVEESSSLTRLSKAVTTSSDAFCV